MPKKTVNTVWELWTFDVWGNARDGYDVNDRSCFNREYPLTLKVQKANEGTPREFEYAAPTDRQVKAAFGLRCRIETDGDDLHIDVVRERDGYPIGEMYCTSHQSLSPISEDV